MGTATSLTSSWCGTSHVTDLPANCRNHLRCIFMVSYCCLPLFFALLLLCLAAIACYPVLISHYCCATILRCYCCVCCYACYPVLISHYCCVPLFHVATVVFAAIACYPVLISHYCCVPLFHVATVVFAAMLAIQC